MIKVRHEGKRFNSIVINSLYVRDKGKTIAHKRIQYVFESLICPRIRQMIAISARL